MSLLDSSIRWRENGIFYILIIFKFDGNAWLLISVTEDGIVICVNDEHSLKAESPIEVTEDGIVICVNFLQSLKHSVSISFSFIKRYKISWLFLFAAFLNGEKL